MKVRMVAGAVGAIIVVCVAAFLIVRVYRGGGTSEANTARYSGEAIAFDYPSNWHQETYEKESSFSSAIVFLSTAQMHDPCVVAETAGGTSTRCGQPVDQLHAGEMLIEWSANGFPGWTLEERDGDEITIAGHRAALHEDTPGECKYLGADATITAAISREGRYNWYQMRACLKGPGIDALRKQVMDMLESTEIHQG